jgi:DNA-binding transcriptional MocR family regulator
LPRDVDLTTTAPAFGVAIGPGYAHFAAEPPGTFLRLSFAAAADEAELVEGGRRLRDLWHQLQPARQESVVKPRRARR